MRLAEEFANFCLFPAKAADDLLDHGGLCNEILARLLCLIQAIIGAIAVPIALLLCIVDLIGNTIQGNWDEVLRAGKVASYGTYAAIFLLIPTFLMHVLLPLNCPLKDKYFRAMQNLYPSCLQ